MVNDDDIHKFDENQICIMAVLSSRETKGF